MLRFGAPTVTASGEPTAAAVAATASAGSTEHARLETGVDGA
jgi:hypothetical protein